VEERGPCLDGTAKTVDEGALVAPGGPRPRGSQAKPLMTTGGA